MLTITDILQELEIPFLESGHHHCRSGWCQTDCPFCGIQNHWRLGIHLSTGRCSCWACGSHRLDYVLSESSKKPINFIQSLLHDIQFTNYKRIERVQGKLRLPQNLGPLLSAHRKYLKKRGFDPDKLEKIWGLRGIGVDTKLPWRIWIPFVHKHRIVSWTTRSISNNGLRYITAKVTEEEENHKQLLFGGDFVKNAVVVVEGPMDAFRIGPGAVATFGLGYSRDQLIKISKIPLRVILFDSEPMAQRRAKQLANDLTCFSGTTIIAELQTGKDAAEASSKEIQWICKRFLQ